MHLRNPPAHILVCGIAGLLLINGCAKRETQLERIKQRGELIVLTRNGPTTYYQGPDGPTGFEYDLAKSFAKYLGVKLKIATPGNSNQILPMVAAGDADLAAAGLAVTPQRASNAGVRFGPSYMEITQQVVYRAGTPRPRNIEGLIGQDLEVSADSSQAERLQSLRKQYPRLTWRTDPDTDADELLYLVWEQVIDYTVADSNRVALERHFYPEIRAAFSLGKPEPLAWAFPVSADNSLYDAAVKFFKLIKKNGQLARLVERYYGYTRDFDYVDTRTFVNYVNLRLPALRPLFEQAAEDYGLDWRLLAAIGYQESHWNPTATSPTGVRGIMMLTRITADHLNIKDRLSPEQSIMGGARYFSLVKSMIPKRIPEPDRTWMALAAYNVGFQHLEDARILAQRLGGNPDRWTNVEKALPLLNQPRWFRQTRYGYAHGLEATRYVENIRTYYEVLAWMTRKKPPPENPGLQQALQIDSPLL